MQIFGYFREAERKGQKVGNEQNCHAVIHIFCNAIAYIMTINNCHEMHYQ